MTDDTEIINAVRRDPENGFRILMKEKWEAVYWHIRRLVIHHADAQDATQETAETREITDMALSLIHI